MSDLGATASYRGYRIQGLYILSRILETEPNLIFFPEGIEDLAIKEDNTLKEIVQVKSYDGLILSNLDPSNKGAFFHRALDYIQLDPRPIIRIVNVGTIGPEIDKAWRGDKTARKSISEKMVQHGFTQDQIQLIFENLEIISANEEIITSLVIKRLQTLLTGIDPENAFDLLRQWLADSSELRIPISIDDLITRIDAVGKFLAARAHYHKEWFTNIIPIEDYLVNEDNREELQREFFAGASARYEHILANLDFLRSEKISSIVEAFIKSNIVVIHGASGQGKSTLAYRYLHEHYSSFSRFQIQLIENRQHALSTATALSGYSNAVKIPIVIYLDASPRDQDWFELADQLSNQPFIRLLITIREEDFRRTNIPSHIPFEDVFLEFKEEEARQIYERAQFSGYKLNHLTFKESWGEFGGEGPLLEYVYFLTQTMTLRQRLEEQTRRIQNEVREKKLAPDELQLLRIIAVITAYEGRLNLSSLIGSLKIPEPTLILNFYEKEYLIRISPDKSVIEALHPIRSQILSDILVDKTINPWNSLVELGLPYTLEEDWEIFILHSLHERSDQEEMILNILGSLSPKTWNGIAGIIRCFLWVGVKRYILRNQNLVSRARDLLGPAWFFVLDLNFIGDDAKDLGGWWNDLGNLIPEEKRETIEVIRNSQTPKDDVFQLAKAWLHNQDSSINSPKTLAEWRDASETLYWVSRFKLSENFINQISDELLSKAIRTFPLRDIAEMCFAVYKSTPTRISQWLDNNAAQIKIRLFEDYRIVSLEKKDDTIFIHFLSYPEEIEKSTEYRETKHTIHDETMERINLIRYLYPQFKKYGSQGYGHQIPGLESVPDDSQKTGIPKNLLPPKWSVRLNGIAIGLLRNQVRPRYWEEYIYLILGIREKIVSHLSFLLENVAQYFQRDKPRNYLAEPPVSTGEWDQLVSLIGDMPLLPLTAVDPWGIGQPESNSVAIIQSESLLPNSILQQIYKTYLESERNYFNKINGFLQQVIHVSVINIRAGKLPENSHQYSAIISELESKGVNLKTGFLSYINLWESFSNLKQYQLEFRYLFCDFIDIDLISQLEKDELKILGELFLSWGYFVKFPRTSLGNSKKQIFLRHEQQFEIILKNISEAILSLETDILHIQVLDSDLLWEGNSALWLQIDMESPLMIHKNIEQLITTLRKYIGESQYGDINYFIVENKFKHTVIIPTIKGKSIDSLIWPLQTTKTLMQNHAIEEKQYLYFPKATSMDILLRFGIEIWSFKELESIQKLEAGFSSLLISLSLLSRSSEIPEFPEELLPALKSYFSIRSSEISEFLKMFIESATIFLDFYNNLPNKEIESNEFLDNAFLALKQFNDTILTEDGILQINLEDMPKLSKELQELAPTIQIIKLIWLDEVIKN